MTKTMVKEIAKEAKKFEGYPTFTISEITDFLEKCENIGCSPNRMIRKYIERKIPFSFDENPHLSELCENRSVNGDIYYTAPIG